MESTNSKLTAISDRLIESEIEKNAYGAKDQVMILSPVEGIANFSVDYFFHLKIEVQKKRINGRFKLDQNCYETRDVKQYDQWITTGLREEENRPDPLGKILDLILNESQKGLFPRKEKFVFTSYRNVFILVETCRNCNGDGSIKRTRYITDIQYINGRRVDNSRIEPYWDSCHICSGQGYHSTSARIVTSAQPGIRARFPANIPEQIRNAITDQTGLYNLPHGVAQVSYQKQQKFPTEQCAMLTYAAKCPFLHTNVLYGEGGFEVFSYGIQLRLGHMDHLIESILKSELIKYQAIVRKYKILRSAQPLKTQLARIVRSAANQQIINEPITTTADTVAKNLRHAVSNTYVWTIRNTIKQSLHKLGQRQSAINAFFFLPIAAFASFYQLQHHYFQVFAEGLLWKSLAILGGIPLLSTCATIGLFELSLENNGGKQLKAYSSKIGVTKLIGWQHFWLMLILVPSIFYGLRHYLKPMDAGIVTSQTVVIHPPHANTNHRYHIQSKQRHKAHIHHHWRS